jgi:hypothetical protein
MVDARRGKPTHLRQIDLEIGGTAASVHAVRLLEARFALDAAVGDIVVVVEHGVKSYCVRSSFEALCCWRMIRPILAQQFLLWKKPEKALRQKPLTS